MIVACLRSCVAARSKTGIAKGRVIDSPFFVRADDQPVLNSYSRYSFRDRLPAYIRLKIAFSIPRS